MRSVGRFEAKTHLPALLEQVERGEEIVITRHGKAIARLVPAVAVSPGRLEHTVARLKSFRKGAGSARSPPRGWSRQGAGDRLRGRRLVGAGLEPVIASILVGLQAC